ncbi:hypothetical protein C8F01DRAFT_284331 [Mycena amicta]|nr:hypothetical protein C8F01DRAFT_284331 [Mycena amicta]
MSASSSHFGIGWTPAGPAAAQTRGTTPRPNVPWSSSPPYTSAPMPSSPPVHSTYPSPSYRGVVSPASPPSPISVASWASNGHTEYAPNPPWPPISTTPPSAASTQGELYPYPNEYSIFVGDLAPEASNSDLVEVFRNPILGLRNDRAPKFIRPFTSCKSAKIMLDPTTGVSRGYGFVRFAEEADQQRALVEMHGLYCLSRPMRISPATAKVRPPTTATYYPQTQTPSVVSPAIPPSRSVIPNPGYTTHQSSTPHQLPPSHSPLHHTQPSPTPAPGADTDTTAAEWQHHAHARAILGNLIGPNGEHLTSTDPYNTTVFVGGLSPLVGEDTLRTLFVPFGEIHYVKVPAGKHCGFVQFVRKADAEQAIETMQGFAVGGSRIRLSWGRSQYKAAQAAALQVPLPPSSRQPESAVGGVRANAITPPMLAGLTKDQIVALLEKALFGDAPATSTYPGVQTTNVDVNTNNNVVPPYGGYASTTVDHYYHPFRRADDASSAGQTTQEPQYTEEVTKVHRHDGPFALPQRPYGITPPPPSFSSFRLSPDPRSLPGATQQRETGGEVLTRDRRDSSSYSALRGLPHSHAPGFFFLGSSHDASGRDVSSVGSSAAYPGSWYQDPAVAPRHPPRGPASS